MTDRASALFEATAVQRTFALGDGGFTALAGVTMRIEPGEFVAITGASGSGKTTLLSILGLLDRGYQGSLKVLGKDVRGLGERELGQIRNERFGFVFQAFHLVLDATVVQNVVAPALFGRTDRITKRDAEEALDRVGLRGRADDIPRHMSGGERQRVAFARAWAQRPDALLCDEPTGNLDSKNGDAILSLLRDFHHAGKTVIVVTHSDSLAAAASRQIRLRDGKILEEGAS